MERPHLDRAQRAGGDGLQGGHLRGLHDRGAEARPEGVRVDSVQEQGGVGEQHKVKLAMCIMYIVYTIFINQPIRAQDPGHVITLDQSEARNKLSKVTIRENFVNKGGES